MKFVIKGQFTAAQSELYPPCLVEAESFVEAVNHYVKRVGEGAGRRLRKIEIEPLDLTFYDNDKS